MVSDRRESKIFISFDDLDRSVKNAIEKNETSFSFLDMSIDGVRRKELVLIDPSRKVKPTQTKTHIIQDRGGLTKMKTEAHSNPKKLCTLEKFKIFKG